MFKGLHSLLHCKLLIKLNNVYSTIDLFLLWQIQVLSYFRGLSLCLHLRPRPTFLDPELLKSQMVPVRSSSLSVSLSPKPWRFSTTEQTSQRTFPLDTLLCQDTHHIHVQMIWSEIPSHPSGIIHLTILTSHRSHYTLRFQIQPNWLLSSFLPRMLIPTWSHYKIPQSHSRHFWISLISTGPS